jgi:hypothetical protein
MIQSTPSPDRTPRPGAPAPQAARPAAQDHRADHFSAGHTAELRSSLRLQPEIRPEVVARGRELLADPSYPSRDILTVIGRAILAAPDLSEDLA